MGSMLLRLYLGWLTVPRLTELYAAVDTGLDGADLNAGDAPVLVTLGTSAAAGDPQVFARVARALDALGLRGLYLTSNDANGSELRGRPGVWPYLPLEAILPRVRGVVHSGSHGTNALVLAAGKPSVITASVKLILAPV